MTGYQSKKAASLDEEGFYTIHPKDEDDDIQVYQRPWVGLTDEEMDKVRQSMGYNQFMSAGEYAKLVQIATQTKLKEKNNG